MPSQSKATKKDVREQVLHRIARVQGQLNGIRRMIEEEDQCMDVLTQILAVRSAVSMLGLELLKEELLCKGKNRPEINETFLKTLFTLQ